jgi:endonuclease I/V8-like Glu-specific endopeptidase
VTDALLDRLEAVIRRFDERAERRAQTLRLLEHEGVLRADTPARVEKRLRRLNCSWSLARAIEQTPAVASTGRSLPDALSPESFGADVLGLERLMGRNDLIDVGFLERGFLASRSVGRITIRSASGSLDGYGTGFLISPRLLLTNNHVLSSAAAAANSYVEFNYQAGVDGMPMAPDVFALAPQDFFLTSVELDFSVVAVQPQSETARPLTAFGSLRLIEQEGKVVLGELVNIIQHPNGEPKQLALRENMVVDMLELFLHYETDTEPGSSGSPVFNDQWEVVALHHSGVPRRDETGALLALDGSRWTREMGEERLAWVANEGIRISRVLRELRDQPLTAGAADLRAQLFEAPAVPPVPTAESPDASPDPSSPSAVGAAGPQAAAQWSRDSVAHLTLPLRITVGVGVGAGPSVPLMDSSVDPAKGPTSDLPSPPAGVDQAVLRSGLASLEANRNRTYYDEPADAEARARYYQGVQRELDPAALFAALAELLERTHAPMPRYRPSDHVYPWVDLHPDRLLRSIYSGRTYEPEQMIHEDARVEAMRTARLEEFAARETAPGAGEFAAELAALEASLPYNCEHVVPQSSFAEREPMRGDLHHLFTCESGCNSFRGNTPYFDFGDEQEIVRAECGRREEGRFEPSAGKGAVARATLYFLLRYPGVLGDQERELQGERLPVLLDWHKAEPVGEWEHHRNGAIAEIQGNRNPLIDHPDWAERISFHTGFG